MGQIKPFEPLIRGYSLMYELDTSLVCAIILQESAGNQYAYRYEPAFFERYLKGKSRYELIGACDPVSLDSELMFRSCSFGLMQIMGQTAREFSYSDQLPTLFTPNNNIELGCKILRKYIDEAGSVELGVTAYNRGLAGAKKHGVSEYYYSVLKKKNRAGELITIL